MEGQVLKQTMVLSSEPIPIPSKVIEMSKFKCKTCKCKFDVKDRNELVCDRDDCPQMPHPVEKAVINFDDHEIDLDWEIVENWTTDDEIPPIHSVPSANAIPEDLEEAYWNRMGGCG
jgi:hypothetical protein